MFFKVVTALSIVTVCCGLPYEPEHSSKQAVSSQSYVRQDVPLSYKYSAVHIYSTPKPVDQTELKFTRVHQTGVNLPQNIQYAPLVKPRGQVQKLYTTITDPNRYLTVNNEYTSEVAIKKDHLEPKVVHNLAMLPQTQFPYISGHNIELLQSVNRSPGHNALYRSYPENTSSKDKQTKINYQRAFTLYKKPENQHQIASQNSNSDAKAYVAAPEQKIEQHSNIYNIGYEPSANANNRQSELKQLPKTHKLILNLARGYNIARQNFKAPVMMAGDSDFPLHTQAFIRKDSSLIKAPSNKITKLFPLQDNKKHVAIQRFTK